MAQAELDVLKRTLRTKSRAELEELALAESMAHARICAIAGYNPPGHEEEHRHATEAEMRERIKGKSTDELIDILAQSALVAEAMKA